MPRVHFVKAARKDNPVAKKGESYYWWKPMVGGRGGAKRFSKNAPKPSQVTTSEFLSQVYEVQERIEDVSAAGMTFEDFNSFRDELVSDLESIADEQEEKHQNLPEGLQYAPTGELLEQRAEEVRSWAQELMAIDCDEPDRGDFEDETDYDDALFVAIESALQALFEIGGYQGE